MLARCFSLKKISMFVFLFVLIIIYYLVGHRFVFQPRFVEDQFQLSLVEIGHAQRFYKSSIFTSLQGLSNVKKRRFHLAL